MTLGAIQRFAVISALTETVNAGSNAAGDSDFYNNHQRVTISIKRWMEHKLKL